MSWSVFTAAITSQCQWFCSIIGLYVGMVFVIGQFVRSFTSDGAYTIMFEELPNVDRIMKICKDLYFVREHKELQLEEEMYSRLVFLYRFVSSSLLAMSRLTYNNISFCTHRSPPLAL